MERPSRVTSRKETGSASGSRASASSARVAGVVHPRSAMSTCAQSRHTAEYGSSGWPYAATTRDPSRNLSVTVFQSCSRTCAPVRAAG
jgi:hypothetical protein